MAGHHVELDASLVGQVGRCLDRLPETGVGGGCRGSDGIERLHDLGLALFAGGLGRVARRDWALGLGGHFLLNSGRKLGVGGGFDLDGLVGLLALGGLGARGEEAARAEQVRRVALEVGRDLDRVDLQGGRLHRKLHLFLVGGALAALGDLALLLVGILAGGLALATLLGKYLFPKALRNLVFGRLHAQLHGSRGLLAFGQHGLRGVDQVERIFGRGDRPGAELLAGFLERLRALPCAHIGH